MDQGGRDQSVKDLRSGCRCLNLRRSCDECHRLGVGDVRCSSSSHLQHTNQRRRSAGTRRRERQRMNEEELLNLEGVSEETLENLKDNKGDD